MSLDSTAELRHHRNSITVRSTRHPTRSPSLAAQTPELPAKLHNTNTWLLAKQTLPWDPAILTEHHPPQAAPRAHPLQHLLPSTVLRGLQVLHTPNIYSSNNTGKVLLFSRASQTTTSISCFSLGLLFFLGTSSTRAPRQLPLPPMRSAMLSHKPSQLGCSFHYNGLAVPIEQGLGSK